MRKSISAALIKNSGSSDSPSGAGGPAAGIRRHLRVFCFRDKLFAILPFVTSLNKLLRQSSISYVWINENSS